MESQSPSSQKKYVSLSQWRDTQEKNVLDELAKSLSAEDMEYYMQRLAVIRMPAMVFSSSVSAPDPVADDPPGMEETKTEVDESAVSPYQAGCALRYLTLMSRAEQETGRFLVDVIVSRNATHADAQVDSRADAQATAQATAQAAAQAATQTATATTPKSDDSQSGEASHRPTVDRVASFLGLLPNTDYSPKFIARRMWKFRCGTSIAFSDLKEKPLLRGAIRDPSGFDQGIITVWDDRKTKKRLLTLVSQSMDERPWRRELLVEGCSVWFSSDNNQKFELGWRNVVVPATWHG